MNDSCIGPTQPTRPFAGFRRFPRRKIVHNRDSMLRSLRPAGAWVAPRPAAHIPNPWARIGSHDNPASGFQQEGAREIFATWGYVFGRTAARPPDRAKFVTGAVLRPLPPERPSRGTPTPRPTPPAYTPTGRFWTIFGRSPVDFGRLSDDCRTISDQRGATCCRSSAAQNQGRSGREASGLGRYGKGGLAQRSRARVPGGNAARHPAARDARRRASRYLPSAALRPARRPNDMAIEWLAPATVTG